MRIVLSTLLLPTLLLAAELPDIRSVPPDLEVPALSEGPPAFGKRVRHGLSVLYLPTDWKADAKWPVIVELAGNGGYTNKFGDVSAGLPEGSNLGYGLSAGRGFIWLCVPYLSAKGDQIAIKWWGDAPAHDPQPTLKNLRETVTGVCRANRLCQSSHRVNPFVIFGDLAQTRPPLLPCTHPTTAGFSNNSRSGSATDSSPPMQHARCASGMSWMNPSRGWRRS